MPSLWTYLRERDVFPVWLLQAAEEAWSRSQQSIGIIEEIRSYNQLRILDVFRDQGVSAFHFTGSTGYGYGDTGRDVLESTFAQIFGTEMAIVRPNLVSGTHAIATALFGLLRPGDELIFASGKPYDTILKTIGVIETPGSLKDYGVDYREIPLSTEGHIDVQRLLDSLSLKTKVVAFQRSRGYSWRPSLSNKELGEATAELKKFRSDLIVFVDNCYGEFVEATEPTHQGADLIAGSLIKNPGGTLAPYGGYIAGREDLLAKIFSRLTAPGLGPDVGPTGEAGLRLFFQGLYMAPHFVGEALVGAVFAARLLSDMGLEVSPSADGQRHDLIQGIRFPDQESLVQFCHGIQSASPVDSLLKPEPAPMAGYADPIIMSAGSFVQGSSSELSADAPLREPPYLFMQGGSTREQVIYAVIKGVMESKLRKYDNGIDI